MDPEDGEVLLPPETSKQGGARYTAVEGTGDKFTASPGSKGHSNQLEQSSNLSCSKPSTAAPGMEGTQCGPVVGGGGAGGAGGARRRWAWHRNVTKGPARLDDRWSFLDKGVFSVLFAAVWISTSSIPTVQHSHKPLHHLPRQQLLNSSNAPKPAKPMEGGQP